MNIQPTLRTIGLTNSEVKVYLALLELGASSKGGILKEAKIAPSKIYHVLDKLILKGLATMIIKDNVRHYSAVSVSRIMDYLNKKKAEIEEEERSIAKILPTLENLQKRHIDETKAEVFFGWKGMDTAYSSVLNNLNKGQVVYILGASEGADPKKTRLFFLKYGALARKKRVGVKVIFNENTREYVKDIEKILKTRFKKRFLFKTTPVEVAIANNITGIIILKEIPLVILIQDKEVSESFITYFNELWKIAKL